MTQFNRKKKSKKKVDTPDKRRQRLFNKHGDNILIMGSSISDTIRVTGFETVGLGYSVKTRKDMVGSLAQYLRDTPMPWSAVTFIFKQISKSKTQIVKVYDFEETTTSSLDKHITPLIHEDWENADKTQAISTGWAAVPQGNFDFDDIMSDILEYFDSINAWDAEHAERYKLIAHLERGLKKCD